MATLIWEVVDRTRCGRLSDRAELLEQRIYPADVLQDSAALYSVRARQCTLGPECQSAGYTCLWSGFNPNGDPFKLREAVPENWPERNSNAS